MSSDCSFKMAPPPEYDKEPKAPDKNYANSNEDNKTLLNVVSDQQTNSDKSSTSAASVKTEVSWPPLLPFFYNINEILLVNGREIISETLYMSNN